MRKIFRFKQFSISDEHCAMKIGTDAVLLGSWTRPGKARTILDIGCGSGILALMMAQQSEARITGIEIHPESAATAALNAEQCPWTERIAVINTSFQEFSVKSAEKFDLILSNPPYFIDSLKAPDRDRSNSRHNDTLTQEELLDGVVRLLSEEGKFALILPYDQEKPLLQKAFIRGLFAGEILHVRAKPDCPPIRSCIELSRIQTSTRVTELCIRTAEGEYTKEYRTMTGEFYL